MNILAIATIIYLIVGIIVLVIFDFITKRIRTRFSPAVDETQIRIAGASPLMGREMSGFVSRRMAVVATVFAMWLFWPAVLYGYIESRLKRRDDADKI